MPLYQFYQSKPIEKCIQCPLLVLGLMSGARDHCGLDPDVEAHRGTIRPHTCPLRLQAADHDRHNYDYEKKEDLLN
jgi:hypothetical protein